MKVYKATRSLHYVDENGEDCLVFEGDIVEGASEQKIADLLADGFIREGRTSQKKEED